MPEVYKKIEKRIVDLKKKEELWKGRYSEIAQQVKVLVDSDSKQMKEMQDSIKNFEGRLQKAETQARKVEDRSEEMLRLMDKRITEFSRLSKGISERFKEKDEEIKKIKSDVTSLVTSIITKHEKTFDSILEKINLAIRKMESELQQQQSIYDNMEATKRFLENYSPPDPPPRRANGSLEIAAKERRREAPSIEDSPSFHRQLKSTVTPEQSIPLAPVPERFESQAPFIYEHESPIASPQSFMRRASPRKPMDDDLDDDMDVDDLISGNMKGFKDSVESMNSNVSSISEKLASVEEKVAKIQTTKSPNLERLDDKIRMYSQSVADIHSRMETVEKGLRDGMTPMMESLKLLTETVKSLKEESKPSLKKPTPPIERKDSWKEGGKTTFKPNPTSN